MDKDMNVITTLSSQFIVLSEAIVIQRCGAGKPDLGIDYNNYRENSNTESPDEGLDGSSVVWK